MVETEISVLLSLANNIYFCTRHIPEVRNLFDTYRDILTGRRDFIQEDGHSIHVVAEYKTVFRYPGIDATTKIEKPKPKRRKTTSKYLYL